MAILESLSILLGVNADTKELKNFNQGLQTVNKGLKALTGVATIATGGIFALSKSSAASADIIGKTASKISLNTDELQQYIYASEQAGGSQESFISSFTNLESKMQEASMGTGSAIQAFKMMGISLTDSNGMMKDTTDVMSEVSDAFASIDDAGLKKNLAGQLGLDSSMITMLQDGSGSIEAMKKQAVELGAVKSPQMIKDSADFGDNMDNTTKVFEGLSNMLTSKFIPIFSNLMKKFNDWYMANKKVIQQRLGVFIKSLTKFVMGFLTIIKNLVVWVDNVAQSFGGWEKVLKYVGIALGAFALFKVGQSITALFSILKLGAAGFKLFGNEALMAQVKAMLIPIAIGALVGFLALLYNDFKVWTEGGQSLFGDYFQKIADMFNNFSSNFPIMGAIIKAVFNIIKSIFSGFSSFIGNIWDLITGKISFNEFLNKQLALISPIIESIKSIFSGFSSFIGNIWDLITGKISFDEFLNKQLALISPITDGIKAIFGGLEKSFGATWDLITGKISFDEFLNKQLALIAPIIDKIKSFFSDIFGGDAIDKQINNIRTIFKDFMKSVLDPFNAAKEKLSSGLSSIGNFLGFGGSDETTEPSPVAQVANHQTTSNTVSSSNTKTDISIPITINGNMDQSTTDGLMEALRKTANNISSRIH